MLNKQMEITRRNKSIPNLFKDGIFGLIVGDALGVPVEFLSREQLKANPVHSMIGYGTHDQPPGTWSDDSSLALCLATSLVHGYDLHAIGDSFLKWYEQNFWTPYEEVFDIGNATREALWRLKNSSNPELAGGRDEHSNGNGSLMRILPLLCLTQNIPEREKRYQVIKEVSSITHAHVRSCLACFYYLEFASSLSTNGEFGGNAFKEAYSAANHSFAELVSQLKVNPVEVKKFGRLTDGQMALIPESEIQSSGYVMHTLEASVWCLLTTSSYEEAVLKAVNLGNDTDTTGAITGGLAGLFYGYDAIPLDWTNQIARKGDILELFEALSVKYGLDWI